MKFGKLCEEACVELKAKAQIPAFPYKHLKKQLKKAEKADDGQQAFANSLDVEVKLVDKAWTQAVRSVLKSALEPRISMAMAKVGLKRRPVSAAPALAEWASIARTGLRKITKKYNKRLGARFGRLAAEEKNFAFVASSERTEIQALASTVQQEDGGQGANDGEGQGQGQGAGPDGEEEDDDGDATSSAFKRMRKPSQTPTRRDPERRGDSSTQAMRRPRLDPEDLECPVCMEPLVNPVAPGCGHPMCRVCFDGLKDSKVTQRIRVPGGTFNVRPASDIPRCPICREPATTAKPMNALASVCKKMAASPR